MRAQTQPHTKVRKYAHTHAHVRTHTQHARTRALAHTRQGERALDFVLSNRGMIDKTLLFDIELLRIQQ